MARHVWRIVATYRDTTVRRFHVQSQRAADRREALLLEGRRMTLNRATAAELKALGQPWPVEIPVVVVTQSNPVHFPHPAGDSVELDLDEI